MVLDDGLLCRGGLQFDSISLRISNKLTTISSYQVSDRVSENGWGSDSNSSPANSTLPPPPELVKGDRRFVILVPVDGPGNDLCKVIASAIALGYPAPIIVNWRKNWLAELGQNGRSHLTKITGTLKYLDQMMHKDVAEGDWIHEDDLVLLVDAYDIWFQLPPDVLLNRYHASNGAANARLAEQWNGTADDVPHRQTIVVSTQKKCFGGQTSDMYCDDFPESPLRPDLYGDKTDSPPDVENNDYHLSRPRYMNSGSIMGPAGDMRRYFRRVRSKMLAELEKQDGIVFSDQGLFAEVFGEQEVWRTSLRNREASSERGIERDEAFELAQNDFEYHVGLDYVQDMFLPTVFEEYDGDIITVGNQTLVDEASAERDISPVRLNGLPIDIQESPNPISEFKELKTKGSSWDTMPLYADFFTTSIPVILHHNAHIDNMKNRRELWWDRTWFFPHLRSLIETHLQRRGKELKPLAQLPVPKGAGKLNYWPTKSNKENVLPKIFREDKFKEPLEEADFAKLCVKDDEKDEKEKPWYKEVFRDAMGPL